jgi:hypothetical protein
MEDLEPVVCNRCEHEFVPFEQSYYYCKQMGFCIWCVPNN